MKRIAKPAVGQRVAVTTRHRSYYIFRTKDWYETTHIGEVLKPEYWFTPDQFKLSAEGFRMGTRVLDMRFVVAVDLLPAITDNRNVGSGPTAFITKRGNRPMSTKSIKAMSWNDRLALLDHYKPSEGLACSALGVTADELATAREMQASGTFTPTPNLDVGAYASLFPADKPATISGATSTKAPKRDSGTTSIAADKPATATKPIKAPKKRGRKGDKIVNAFGAIPANPTPAEDFATKHSVSLAVLRQSKRFDPTPDKGPVRVKKDKESKTLMIWREAPSA